MTSNKTTLRQLWREFLPLSLSDVTMALSDPLVSGTLAHLPSAQPNLAALGVGKSLAVCLESPIIMILHASNVLSATRRSRRALWKFVLVSIAALTVSFFVLCLPWTFRWAVSSAFGLDASIAERTRIVLFLLVFWPAAIAWRRYFQGLLICYGHNRIVAWAGLGRIGLVAAALVIGYHARVNGEILGPLALMAGIVGEAVWVTWPAWKLNLNDAPDLPDSDDVLPADAWAVWNFYRPLANTMILLWGGRALLLAIIARAGDAPLALAAWPMAWGIVQLLSNATRMVQQVVLRHAGRAPSRLLFTFALSAGGLCSTMILMLVATPLGGSCIGLLSGGEARLAREVSSALALCVLAPILVSVQNALQGYLIGSMRTRSVNLATAAATAVMLLSAVCGIRLGLSGASAAAAALMIFLGMEILLLGGAWRSNFIGLSRRPDIAA